MCSVHLKATGLNNESLEESKQEATTVHKIAKAVMKRLRNEKDIVVLGDFNMSPDCQGERVGLIYYCTFVYFCSDFHFVTHFSSLMVKEVLLEG